MDATRTLLGRSGSSRLCNRSCRCIGKVAICVGGVLDVADVDCGQLDVSVADSARR